MDEQITPRYGERIVRVETELKEARRDIARLEEKVDDLLGEMQRIKGVKATLAGLILLAGGLISAAGGWLAKKLGLS